MAKKIPPPDDQEEGAKSAPSFGGMAPRPDAGAPDEGTADEPTPDEGESDTGAAATDEGGQGQEAAPAEGGTAQQGRKASPEQEAQYRQFVFQGFHVIYHDHKPDPALLKRLATGEPKQALADAAVNIVMRLVTSSREQGVKLDGGVILHGGKRLFEELADLSAAAKIHQYTDGELDASWVIAMDLAQKQMMAAKLIDPAAFVRDVQEMNKAEAEGHVDDILPGLGKLVDEVKAGQQKGAAPQPAPDDGEAAPADDEEQPRRFGGFGKGG